MSSSLKLLEQFSPDFTWDLLLTGYIDNMFEWLKALRTGKGTRASYDTAKRITRHAVHHAHQEANKKVYENIDPTSSEVYCLDNQFRRKNADVVGDKLVKNDAEKMSVSKDSKQKA